MSERVRITDVSPRDGLQNEAGAIPTSSKLELIEALLSCGLDEIEITSFVSPKWVPQLGDAAEVCAGVRRMLDRAPTAPPVLSALVPNERGFERLLEERGRGLALKMGLFTAASETFNKRNTNATIGESIERFGPLVERARDQGIEVRGYISCAIACPQEGPIEGAAVGEVASALAGLGVDEIDLGDTIGAGTPETVRAMLEAVRARLEREGASAMITLHLHDTFGRGAACASAALELGVRSFDGSVGGLGGCPYASQGGRRAPGNISTETLVRTVREAGFETGVDLARLEAAAEVARRIVREAQVAGGAS